MRIKHGPYSLNSSRSTSPGLVRLFVVGLDTRKGLLAPELPGKLTPKRAHHRAVGLGHRITGRDLVAHQHHTLDRRQYGFPPASSGSRRRPSKLTRSSAGEEVIQRQHRVGLAAAEVRLQLHDWVAAAARQSLNGTDEELLQAFSQIGRRKNSTGFRYSSDPSPRWTCQRSAANSACW